jgi:plasmid replication initiation protein
MKKRGLVVSSNDIIHAKYSLSLWQKRVFLYFVSLIAKDAKEFEMQKVYISDLIKYFECEDSKAVYDIIASVPKQLFETSIELSYISEEGENRFGEVRLITKYTRPEEMKDDTYIEFKFNNDLKQHLLELKNNFSKYDMQNIIPLQSIYAIRIFEILKSYQYQKTVTLEVEYLKGILEISDKYNLYTDFKRSVIDKAQKEIAENCDIAFRYEEKKRGKKVIALIFTIYENKAKREKEPRNRKTKTKESVQTSLFKKVESNEQDDLLYNEFSQVVVNDFGVSPVKLVELIKTYDPERIRKQIRIVQRKVKKGSLENIAGFFMEAVKHDYHDPEEAKEQKKKQRQQRAEQVQLLKLEIEGIDVEFEEKKNDKIRALTNERPELTTEIIESIKNEFVVKKRLEMLNITSSTIDDFRNDIILRGTVKNAIIQAHKAEFEALIKEHGERKKQLEEQIKALSK